MTDLNLARHASRTVPSRSTFQAAEFRDAPALAELVNSAFAGNGATEGWTNETHLLDGPRTHADEIATLMTVPGARFVMLYDGDALIGCVYVKTIDDAGYFGLLAVRPDCQARGIGSQLIAEAERVAREEWRCAKVRIGVVAAHRPELRAYYERRGYVRTGKVKPWVRNTDAVFKVAGVRSEWMEKAFA